RTSDWVASSPSAKARGMRIATPFDGPRPGSAPMIVPRNAPATARNRVNGVRATPNPIERLASVSMRRAPSAHQRPGKGGEPQAEAELEDDVQNRRESGPHDHALHRLRIDQVADGC